MDVKGSPQKSVRLRELRRPSVFVGETALLDKTATTETLRKSAASVNKTARSSFVSGINQTTLQAKKSTWNP